MTIKHSIKKTDKNTHEIKLHIPWDSITAEFDKAFAALAEDVTVEGFRKGKAPKAVAEKHIPREKVYDTMLRTYLPEQYERIVKEEKIEPVYTPKIELSKAKENEDWEITFLVAVRPEVKLGDYKKVVKEAKEKAEAPKILIPGKDDAKEEKEPTEAQKREASLQAALNALTEKIKVEISDVIIEDELHNRFHKLQDDLNRLGISPETYAQSRKTTEEGLKEEMRKEIEEGYKMEFILQEIADQEKIQVEKEDVEKMMSNLQSEEEKKAFIQNMYYYASLLRKQKILDYLMGL